MSTTHKIYLKTYKPGLRMKVGSKIIDLATCPNETAAAVLELYFHVITVTKRHGNGFANECIPSNRS